MDDKAMVQIGRRLVDWYAEHARDLPWRRDPTPYAVWVSEVMLQQTAVSAVIPYYERWMERWPDVEALAGASQQQALSAWEGLGYYRRARDLHAAARVVLAEHGGALPREEASLRALPGIGPYVAAAIRSFAFGADVVAVDANVVRVTMRLANMAGTGREPGVRRRAARLARAGMPPGRSPDYNQALMDFGSAICRPRAPECGRCFLRGGCGAWAAGRQYDVPEPRRKRIRRIRTAIVLFLRSGRVYVQQRGPDGMFAAMWEFPGGKAEHGESPRQAAARECLEELGVEPAALEKLTELTHYYTVFAVRLHAYVAPAAAGLPQDAMHRWVTLDELAALPMPSANRQVVGALGEWLAEHDVAQWAAR